MIKVLFVGDAIINSGFSTVTHNICNELSKFVNLEVYGIGYDGTTKNPYPYHVYPALHDRDIYSFMGITKIIESQHPDVVVLFNDDNIIERYINCIKDTRVITLFPINLLPLNTLRMLAFSNPLYNICDVLTYTQFSVDEIKKLNTNLRVHPIYHGVDYSTFFPFEIKDNFLKNKFVVGNVNINSYRKRLDLFLKGFAKFAENKDDVTCIIHSTNRDIAYDLQFITDDLGITDKVVFSRKNKSFQELNQIYNLMDVVVNTSIGEGFGLPLLEGAACKKAVLCPEHGNLKDIWGDAATYIKIKEYEYVYGSSCFGGVIDTDDMANKLTTLYEDRILLKERKEAAFSKAMEPQFNWKNVAKLVLESIQRSHKGRPTYIE